MSPPTFSLRAPFLVLVLATLWALVVRPALAEPKQPAEPPQAAQQTEIAAHARYKEAYAAIERKDWPTARLLLQRLWEEFHTYDVAASLAQVNYQLKDFAAAAGHMAFAAANLPPKEKPETAERFRTGLAELKELVGAVKVSVDVAGATVTLDGRPVGVSPLDSELFVDGGPHWLEAKLEGHGTASQRFYSSAGEELSVALELARPQAPPEVHEAAPAPLGAPGDPTRDTGARDRPSADRAPTIVTGVTTVVSLGTGIGFLVSSAVKADRRDDLLSDLEGAEPCTPRPDRPSACATIVRLADKTVTYRAVGVASLGVALIAGIATYLLWPNEPHPARSGWQPTAEIVAAPGEPRLDVRAGVRAVF